MTPTTWITRGAQKLPEVAPLPCEAGSTRDLSNGINSTAQIRLAARLTHPLLFPSDTPRIGVKGPWAKDRGYTSTSGGYGPGR